MAERRRSSRRQARPDATPGSPNLEKQVSRSGAGITAATESPGCTVHEGLRTLVHLLPRVMRGLRKTPAEMEPTAATNLGPRHRSALAFIAEDDTSVGALAAALDLTLATASGLVADLEQAGFVERSTDPADRRRTIVRIPRDQKTCVESWLQGASAPLLRVLEKLSPSERSVLVKAVSYLDTELNNPAYTPTDPRSEAPTCDSSSTSAVR